MLNSVYAFDENNVWAVGVQGTILKYNGESWTAQTSGTSRVLNSVYALDQNNVWAVGGNIVLLTTDGGNNWTQLPLPTPTFNARSVVAINKNTAYVVRNISAPAGTNNIYKLSYSGGSWSWTEITAFPIDKNLLLEDIEIDSTGTIWVAGKYDQGGGAIDGAVYYSTDGATWERVHNPYDPGVFSPLKGISIWGNGEKKIVVGTEIYQIKEYNQDGFDYIYEIISASKSLLRAVNDIVGIEDNLAAVTDGLDWREGLILDYNGTVWSEGLASGWSKINDADVDSSGNFWAVGDINGNGPVIAKKISGGEWNILNLEQEFIQDYYAVLAISETKIWAIGESSAIRSNDGGATWEIVFNNDGIITNAYYDKGGSKGWFTSSSGGIYYKDGEEDLALQDDETFGSINSISGVDNQNIWVVGNEGTIGKTSDGGENWDKINIAGLTAHLFGVYARTATEVYVVGSVVNGMSTIYRTYNGGESWDKLSNPASVVLRSVYATEDELWVGGDNGAILHYSMPPTNTATKLLIALPGQEFADGIGLIPLTVNVLVKAGQSMPVKTYAVDAENNLDISSGLGVRFTSTDPNDTNPASITLGSGDNSCGVGVSSFIFHTPTASGQSWTIYANDISGSPPLTQGSSSGSTIAVSPGVEGSMYFIDGSTRTNIAGKSSSAITVGFKDEYGTITTVDSTRTVTYSSSSATGRFSVNENGPWTSSLDVTLSAGTLTASAYFIDYVVGDSTVTVSSNSSSHLSPIVLSAQTIMGEINPSKNGGTRVTAFPVSLYVGEQSTVSITIRDRYGNPAVGKTVKLNSSRVGDNITNPASATNASGVTTGKISSLNPGKLNIYAYDETDGIWLEEQPEIYFSDIPTPSTAIVSATNSYIKSDKDIITIDKNKAVISAFIRDELNNPIANVVVGLLFDGSYGDLSVVKSLTEADGKAEFVFTPKKEGKVNFKGITKDVTLSNSIVIEIKSKGLLEGLLDSDVSKKIANILNPIVTATAVLGLIPLIAGIISGLPAGLHTLTYGVSLSMEALGIRKKRKNWGRVYDSTTGKGVDLALVRLYNQQNMKLIGTIVTNLKGRYHFQPEPGTYVISVTKDGYIYPTQIFAEYGIARVNKNASKINSHYLGQPINIKDKDDFFNIDIPIDPVSKSPSAILKLKIWTEDIAYLITFTLSYIFMPTLVIGAVLSAFVAIVIPGTRNTIVSVIYLLIILVYVLSKMIKAYNCSTVIDAKGKPIQGVMISIFDKEHNTLKESRITDRFGRFSIYADPGQYILKAERRGYEFDPDKLKHEISKIKPESKFRGKTVTLNKPDYIRLTIMGRKG